MEGQTLNGRNLHPRYIFHSYHSEWAVAILLSIIQMLIIVIIIFLSYLFIAMNITFHDSNDYFLEGPNVQALRTPVGMKSFIHSKNHVGVAIFD